MRLNKVQQANRRKAVRIYGRLSSYTDMNNPAKGGITFLFHWIALIAPVARNAGFQSVKIRRMGEFGRSVYSNENLFDTVAKVVVRF